MFSTQLLGFDVAALQYESGRFRFRAAVPGRARGAGARRLRARGRGGHVVYDFRGRSTESAANVIVFVHVKINYIN